jgi:hypothetical protein
MGTDARKSCSISSRQSVARILADGNATNALMKSLRNSDLAKKKDGI